MNASLSPGNGFIPESIWSEVVCNLRPDLDNLKVSVATSVSARNALTYGMT